MQKNKACPNFFNGGSLMNSFQDLKTKTKKIGTIDQYQDYRHFVISRFPDLQELDVTPVSKEEREESMKKYGDLNMTNLVEVYEEKKKKKN